MACLYTQIVVCTLVNAVQGQHANLPAHPIHFTVSQPLHHGQICMYILVCSCQAPGTAMSELKVVLFELL